jgi:hypothetical protein
MIELLIFAAGAATGAVAMMLPYNRAVTERDMLQVTKDTLAFDVEKLTGRVTTLRGDNLALEKSVDNLRIGHDRLVDERDQAVRELGRLKAEAVAAKPKRGANGKFVSKNAGAVPKSMPKPVACG